MHIVSGTESALWDAASRLLRGVDAKPETVKFFYPASLGFFFYLKKEFGKRCAAGTGMRVLLQEQRWQPAGDSSWKAELSPQPRGDESCWSLSPPSSSCSRAGVAVPGCVVLGTSSDKLVSAGRWPVPPSPAWGGFWAVTEWEPGRCAGPGTEMLLFHCKM